MRRGAALAALLAATVAAGCSSTHDKARRVAEETAKAGAKKAAVTTLKITKNAAIDTKVAAILSTTSQDGLLSAVVVELTSRDPKHSVVWAPIDVVLKGADGSTVGQANTAGANPILVHLPSLPAGATAYYVNDQFTPTAKPVSAEVTLGGELRAIQPVPGVLQVTAKMAVDPDYGPQFAGTVTNTSAVRQQQVIVQAIARRGTTIVAAGTAIVDGLDPGKSADFTGSLIGDIKGATLDVFAPVSDVAGVPGAVAPTG